MTPPSGPAHTTPVLILRRRPGPLQHGTLAAARTMGRWGVPVYVVSGDGGEPCTSSRYMTGKLQLPLDGDADGWVNALMRGPDSLDGGILLPVDDASAVTVAEYANDLGRRFRLPDACGDLHRRLTSKRFLSDLADSLGVAVPGSETVDSPGQAAVVAERFGFPVVLKAAEMVGDAGATAGESVAVVRDITALLRRWRSVAGEPARPVIVQEFLGPDVATIWMFNGYFDGHATCRFAATGVKLRQHPLSGGATTLGVCRSNPELESIATGLMSALGYRGPVDMDFCFDARDQRYKLLDVNPRVGATFRLFATAQLDVVRTMYLDLVGRDVPAARPAEGRRWLDEFAELAAWRARANAVDRPRWSRPAIRGVQETAWWARDDPAPFARLASTLPRRALRQLATRR